MVDKEFEKMAINQEETNTADSSEQNKDRILTDSPKSNLQKQETNYKIRVYSSYDFLVSESEYDEKHPK